MNTIHSVFSFMQNEEHEPWTLWTTQNSLAELLDPAPTEPRVNLQHSAQNDTLAEQQPTSVYFQRPQYTAVLERMKRAKQNTRSFSVWHT